MSSQDYLYDPTPIAQQQTPMVRPAALPPLAGAGAVKPADVTSRPSLTGSASSSSAPATNAVRPAALPGGRPPLAQTSAPAAGAAPAPASTAHGRPPLLGKFGTYLGDAASGIASTPAGADPITAFAYGFSGARSAEQARADKTAASAQTANDTTYNRSQDAIKNAQKDRELDISADKTAKGQLVDNTGPQPTLTDAGQVQVFKLVGAEQERLRKEATDAETIQTGSGQALIAAMPQKVAAYGAKVRAALLNGTDPDTADMQAHQDISGGGPAAPAVDTRNIPQKIANYFVGGDPGPGEGQPPPPPDGAAPQAPAAPAPSPPPAATQPTAAPQGQGPASSAAAIPPPPPNVPPGSMYSPSRSLWKAPDGMIYDQNGKPVTGG